MNKIRQLFVAAALLAGCARTAPLEFGPEHPANPNAVEATMPAPSRTLAVAPSIDVVSSPGDAKLNEAGTKGEMQQDHLGHGERDPAAAPSPAHLDAATKPAARQPLYACPMHPEVVSTNPNDRCPKCKMKVNKLVKQAPTASTAPTSPAAGHAVHDSDHGGHR